MGTGLKVKTVTTQDTQMGPMTVTASYGDYREVDGILFPFSIKQQVGPQNLDMKVDGIDINKGVSDDLFKID